MPSEQDRVLARLSVDAGLLSQEEAAHYWRRAQAPGAPRFVQLLVQEGRLQPADLERLKVRYYALQRGIDAAQTVLDGEGGPSAPPAARPASPGGEGGEDDAWAEALRKDELLARVLFAQGAVSGDRLRECLDLQRKHRLRLGVVLVKKGYAERGVVEAAIARVRAHLEGAAGAGGAAQPYRDVPTALEAPPAPPADPDEAPTVIDGPEPGPPRSTAQDGVDTVLNAPVAAEPPAFDPFDTGPATGLSVEELNPFADVPLGVGPPARAERPPQGVPPRAAPPAPTAGNQPDAAGEHPPARRPEVGMQPASMGSRPTSGFTRSGVPIGGEADSGSTKMKARERSELKRIQQKRRPRRKQSTTPYLLIGILLAGVGLAVALYFVLREWG